MRDMSRNLNLEYRYLHGNIYRGERGWSIRPRERACADLWHFFCKKDKVTDKPIFYPV